MTAQLDLWSSPAAPAPLPDPAPTFAGPASQATAQAERRPYQEAAVEAFVEFARRGGRRGVVTAPTGCGKTVTGLKIGRRICGDTKRLLWIAHTDELVSQPVQTGELALAWPEAEGATGVVKASSDEWAARVVFASIQTLSQRPRCPECRAAEPTTMPDEDLYDEGAPPPSCQRCQGSGWLPEMPRLARVLQGGMPSLVVVDEVHHSAADSYRRVIESLDTLHLGLSATLERADRRALSCYDRIVAAYSIADAQRDGYLVPHRADRIMSPDLADLEALAQQSEEQQGRELLRHGVAEATAAKIKEHAQGRLTIAFCASVDQARRTAECLRALGIEADYVSGVMPKPDRAAAIARLRAGELQVLCNCAVLTEGFNVRAISCIVVAKPVRSRSNYVQMVGRGLRTADGKSDCLIIDLVGASGHGLVTAATLSGKEEVEEQEDDGNDEEEDDEEGHGGRGEDELVHAYLTHARGLLDAASPWQSRRRLRWLEISPDAYALPAGLAGSVVARRERENSWWVEVHPPRRGKPEPVCLFPVSRDNAMALGVDAASRMGALVLSDAAASWRRRPASDGQLREVARRKLVVPEGRILTSGEAADLLTVDTLRRRLP